MRNSLRRELLVGLLVVLLTATLGCEGPSEVPRKATVSSGASDVIARGDPRRDERRRLVERMFSDHELAGRPTTLSLQARMPQGAGLPALPPHWRSTRLGSVKAGTDDHHVYLKDAVFLDAAAAASALDAAADAVCKAGGSIEGHGVAYPRAPRPATSPTPAASPASSPVTAGARPAPATSSTAPTAPAGGTVDR